MDKEDLVPSTKPARKKMSMEDREKVRSLLLEGGISKSQIARMMNVAFSVIWRFEKRLRETGSIEDRPQSGRPRIYHSPSEDWTEVNGERRFQCTHCFKTFVHHAQMREHVRTHTGETPYKCDKCFKGFRASSSLKRHMVRHSDERPFMCDFCAKTFNTLSSLQLHIRIHTGEKPYKCKFCDRRCTTAGNLNAHMRVHRDRENTDEGIYKVLEGNMNRSKVVIKLDEVGHKYEGENESRSYKNERDQETFDSLGVDTTHMREDNSELLKSDPCRMEIKVEPCEQEDAK